MAASHVGILSVLIKANSAGFEKGLNKSKRATQQFSFGLSKGAAKLGIFGAAIAAAGVSLSKFSDKMFAALDRMDLLAKKSKLFGVTGQELRELQIAGNRAGVGLQQVNMGLQRYIRRSAEVASGTGEAKKAFEAMGLDAKKMLNLPLQEQLKKIADAMQGFNEEKQLAIAQKLFDSEGVAMLNMFKGGAEELTETLAKAREAGLIDDKWLSNAENANDAMAALKDRIETISMGVAGELAPSIKEAAEGFAELVQLARDTGFLKVIQIWAGGMKSITSGFNYLAQKAKEIHSQFVETKFNFGEGADKVKSAAAAIEAASDKYRRDAEAVAKLEETKAKEFNRGYAKQQERFATRAQVRDYIQTPEQKLAAKQKEFWKMWKDGIISLNEYQKASAKVHEEMTGAKAAREQELQKIIQETTSAEMEFLHTLERLKHFFREGDLTKEQFEKAVRNEFDKNAPKAAGGDVRNPAALMKYSAEAISKSLALRQRRGGGVEGKVEKNTEVLGQKLDDILQATLEETSEELVISIP